MRELTKHKIELFKKLLLNGFSVSEALKVCHLGRQTYARYRDLIFDESFIKTLTRGMV
jgi:ACT domain-containing protein